MKKLHALWLSSALVLGLSLPSFADEVQGFIESVDPLNHSILIKDPVTETGKAVRVHPKVISKIKTGSVAKATLKPGSADVETLEVLSTR